MRTVCVTLHAVVILSEAYHLRYHDETYVGGKPRYRASASEVAEPAKHQCSRLYKRGGQIRRRVVANVTGETLKAATKPDMLEIDCDWEEAVKKSLEKKKPADGWPK